MKAVVGGAVVRMGGAAEPWRDGTRGRLTDNLRGDDGSWVEGRGGRWGGAALAYTHGLKSARGRGQALGRDGRWRLHRRHAGRLQRWRGVWLRGRLRGLRRGRWRRPLLPAAPADNPRRGWRRATALLAVVNLPWQGSYADSATIGHYRYWAGTVGRGSGRRRADYWRTVVDRPRRGPAAERLSRSPAMCACRIHMWCLAAPAAPLPGEHRCPRCSGHQREQR